MSPRAYAIIWLSAIAVIVLLTPTFLRWWRRLRGRHHDSTPISSDRVDELPMARSYHSEYLSGRDTGGLDERSWRDLDGDLVFLALDRTVSLPGRQCLYSRLRLPLSCAKALTAFETTVQALSSNAALRQRVREILAPLADRRAADLVHLFFGPVPERPKAWWLFPVLSALSVICLAFVAVQPRLMLALVCLGMINVLVQSWYKPRVRRFVLAFHQVPAFLRASAALGALEISGCSELRKELRDGASQLERLKRSTWWLRFEPDRQDDLMTSIYEYVNMLFLLDVNVFVFACNTIRGDPRLRSMFAALGYLDSAQSVAVWRDALPRWSAPEFIVPERTLLAESLFHPLVNAPVTNDFAIREKSVLITGSNMAGKSTFVRAVGVNAILAQTIHTVCADRWCAPLLTVVSAIGHTDSLADGRSYYLAEVESVRRLVRASGTGPQHLFLLDEIFRGTNTVERVAAAFAVLDHLSRGLDLVIAATHDIELAPMLDARYTALHFREMVTSEQLWFDYLLRPGVSSTRNAIALLQLLQYPKEVVATALARVNWRDAFLEAKPVRSVGPSSEQD